MKKVIILGILAIFCLNIFGIVNSEELTQDTTASGNNSTVCTMDVMTCPSGMTVPRVPELNCEFAPCPDYGTPGIIEPPVEITDDLDILDKKECQTQVQAINAQIVEKDKAYKEELKLLLPAYQSAKEEYLKALTEYKKCISEKISTKMTDSINSTVSSQAGTSGMTANIAVANMTERWVKQNTSISETPQVASAIMPIENINVNELDLEIIELPETDSINCKEQRILLNEKQVKIKAEILKIKELREKYKADEISVKELQAQRQEIIRSCYPGNPASVIKEECIVPKELLEQRKELEKRLMELQTNFTSEDNANKEEFILKHRQVKEEYGQVSEKINSIEKACKQTARVVTQVERCKPDEGLLQEIEKYKKSLLTETDPDTLYKLRIALDYAIKKMNAGCGISSVEGTTEVSTKPVSETEILKQEIQRLKLEIQKKDNEIKSLRESMREFTGEMKSANAEKKKELLETNFDKVLEHTAAVIKSRITKLEEKITDIETTETISEENKKKIISDLNNRIASLTQVLDKLNTATTAEELKQIITDAREIDEKAIIDGRVISLSKSISKLSEILEKHYVDSKNYETYKSSILELSTKVSALTENATKEEFDVLVEDYKSLKKEIITESRNIQPKEKNTKTEVNN